jgi:hypothetical protein
MIKKEHLIEEIMGITEIINSIIKEIIKEGKEEINSKEETIMIETFQINLKEIIGKNHMIKVKNKDNLEFGNSQKTIKYHIINNKKIQTNFIKNGITMNRVLKMI